ncbi:glycohydrolase toxin TNT-related protein [Streptococcus infantis]|uniref:glycohydrolase toxin TNT-related protein n=1 Tax=Streptococcus infantis TaxID=68892 RepID=UPI0026E3A392|nr:glycohydrolase toxin TNT-related protein [Streptococcus infantis]MDO6229097.1 glycohydrolase toxin TNT-related protein [Streptococcus infantis]
MSYNIKFDDITSVQVESQKTMNAWGESMSSLNKAMNDFIKNQNLQGQAISSMRTYLVEVHGTLLQTLANLMNDYSTNLLLYKDGYYQIDGDLHTKLPGKEFTRLHSDLKGSRDKLKPEIELLKTTKSDISDLVSYEGSSHTSTVMNYNFLMNQLKNLDTSITQYESSHSGQDLVAFKELLAATKALIAEHSGKSRNVGTYQSGDFAKLKSVQRFALAYDQAAKQMESRVERVKAAQERDKARFEALAAEDRAKKGWIDLGVGVFTAVIGIVAIVSTMGAATPLVVAGGVVGFGTSVYGLSNAGEGIHNIQLGNAGDIQTKSYNLIRDTAFMGNDKLYHEVGNVFVTASAIMIPIGKTQSVVQGLTEFAIGEAGAYTAGQTAYHVTKLAGGSEEDAQTANFLGNLIGGYTASSVASKFSLNKVKVDVEVPKYNKGQILKNIEESKLARESSNFDQYLAKEKLQRNLNKSTLASRELPKVKVDVEVPKYNKEQILRNIEESRLARESSNFDQYLAKEKFQKNLIGMDPMDRQSYLQWHEYVEAGIEPSDRVKLRNWSYPPEPEFYLKNKNVYDNPDYFNQLTGDTIYPGTPESSLGRVDGSIHKYGFLNGKYKESVILPGTRINRIGSNPKGRYFSPEGATFGEKALPPFMKLQPNSDYIVLKEIPTKEGLVAPWFDEPGMGIQHYTYLTIEELEKGRFLLRLK